MKWYLRLYSRLRAIKLVCNRIGNLTARGAAAMGIAFMVAAIVMPIGLNQIYNQSLTNTTGWNPAVTVIFTILFPILFIVAVSLKAFGKA